MTTKKQTKINKTMNDLMGIAWGYLGSAIGIWMMQWYWGIF